MLKGRLVIPDNKVIEVQREIMTSVDIVGNRGPSRCVRSDSGGLIWDGLYFSILDSV